MQKKIVRGAYIGLGIAVIALFITIFKPHLTDKKGHDRTENGYAGSGSCKDCHERFYELWSPSHHGKAMQSASDVVKSGELIIDSVALQTGNSWFTPIVRDSNFYMEERATPDEKNIKTYPAVWALGGRNIYYFLTPFEGGRLQTLPLAYDLNRKEWYSNPQSAVRHFIDNMPDEEIEWTHPLYTFNTTCHSCHVSQLNKNYDPESNTYHTTWKEPGINCETCHGPSREHVKVCREAEKRGEVPEDLKIVVTSAFTKKQHNSSCAVCHAKMIPLTQSYPPGEPFFQHFNLITLEDPDFYPDGRDLGENYTYTTWMQSPCVENSDLHCVSCHTSSGRYRFKGRENDACVKCHREKVNNFTKHSRHKTEDGVRCTSCHMPETEFARMTRSDHSMQAPTPQATIEFYSPNACNLCHNNESAQWANSHVKKWHGNYQEPKMQLARLIYQARNNNFDNLDEMLLMANNPDVNVIFRNSMIRLLMNANRPECKRTFLEALEDESPLIRASAAEALQFFIDEEAKKALLSAATDSMRVVRISSSIALSHFSPGMFSREAWQIVEHNYAEYEKYLLTRPDNWSAHYNLANFFYGRGMFNKAIEHFHKAAELESEVVSPMVNASMAYSMLGNTDMAEQELLKALKKDPGNAAANFNYGLLLGQFQRFNEAKKHLENALESDSTMSAAAYNLAVISSRNSLDEAIKYSALAARTNPTEPRYTYTLAYYQSLAGKDDLAIQTAQKAIESHPGYVDSYLFIAGIYEKRGDYNRAIMYLNKAVKNAGIPEQYRENIRLRAEKLKEKAKQADNKS
ncbi:MAG: ammonia-forming cytochrome c nitrite reductase subunit c552 [Prolixibacteraceae bacterium]|nr:ammonia-forming cytochrome c nitrite reductase subunit c552 [Prolixibacteraceae bacterium]